MKKFEETKFAQFMASPAGRTTRMVAGLGLIIIGATQKKTKAKASLLAAATIPLSAGAFDFCLISPLFKGPFWERQIRSAKSKLIEVH